MRFITPLRGASLGLACAAFAVATPLLPQAERKLKDSDVKKVASALGDYYVALEKGKGRLEAEAEFIEELQKVNEKKLKGGHLLASLGDVNHVIYKANGYERKAPKRANGSVIEKSLKSSRVEGGTVDYAVWTPPKYKPKAGPYTLILTIPDEGKSAENHIKENYIDGDLLGSTVIAAPKMPGDADTWMGKNGIGSVLLTMRDITDVYAIDVERVFIGGRGMGGEAALQFANMFPDRFAGAFCWAGDGGAGVTAENLEHVPVLITGGGTNATGLADRAKEAKLENVTLDPAGGEAAIVAWMTDKRRSSYPEKFSIVPGERFPTRAYWAQFAPTEDMSSTKLEAAVNRETNTVTLTGSGITECTLYFSDGVVDLSRPVTVIANGGEPVVDTFERSSTQFLQFIKESKSDSGRYYVASKQYSLPLLVDEAGE
jgi:pimeloyl-ACP methyl ester carboxylesterase